MHRSRTRCGSARHSIRAVLTLLVGELLAPQWVQTHGLDVWNVHSARDEIKANEEFNLVLEAQSPGLRNGQLTIEVTPSPLRPALPTWPAPERNVSTARK